MTLITSESLEALLIRTDIDHMSLNLLGIPYDELSALVYPTQPYKTFLIFKRNGKHRVIHEPRQALKGIQEKLLAYLYKESGSLKPCVHGFAKKRSIVTNARAHCSLRTRYVLNIDIADFFPTITFYRVRGLLMNKPFNFSYGNATVLAHVCTYNRTLPQGAPTSPMLANLVCRTLDRNLMALAKRQRATYTRYCDDITLSFSTKMVEHLPASICSFNSGVLHLGDELNAIIAANSFNLNPTKTRLSSTRNRLEVTGLTINKFPNVKRAFVDSLRGALHAWEKYGYAKAQIEWSKRPYKRQTRTDKLPALKNVLWGKLLYVHMVRGVDDVLYTRLAERYNKLCVKERAEDETFSYKSLPVSPVVRNAVDVEEAVFVIDWCEDFQKQVVGGQGTAFAYKNIGLVTCDHVLRSSFVDKSSKKEVTVNFEDIIGAKLNITNPSTGKSWFGKVVYRDADRDVAIIQFDTPNPPNHRHFTGLDSPIERNQKGFLIGFPNHTAGKRANQLPSNVLNTFPQFGLLRVEITGNIRQGNSGGPFVDDLYRVAGVAQQGAKQDLGNDQCLCVTELDKWLADWKAAVTAPTGETVPSSGAIGNA